MSAVVHLARKVTYEEVRFFKLVYDFKLALENQHEVKSQNWSIKIIKRGTQSSSHQKKGEIKWQENKK